jgi:flagellar hook protein FlgE
VDQDGKIIGSFTNGQTATLAQVALAEFNNQEGLSKLGNNTWSETLSSGTPAYGVANTAGRGQVLGSQLELSNVDVASEFTQLIVNQRGYQANSRVVTTADDLLQETLNMKR